MVESIFKRREKGTMKEYGDVPRSPASRRLCLQNGRIAAGAAAVGPWLLPANLSAFEQDGDGLGEKLSQGEAYGISQ